MCMAQRVLSSKSEGPRLEKVQFGPSYAFGTELSGLLVGRQESGGNIRQVAMCVAGDRTKIDSHAM